MHTIELGLLLIPAGAIALAVWAAVTGAVTGAERLWGRRRWHV